MNNQELKHYGVLGMKWGKRKANYNTSDDYNRARALEKKHPSEMTNKELQELNNRQQLEQNYKRNNPNAGKIAIAAVAGAAATLGTVALLYTNSKSTVKAGYEVVDACKNAKANNLSFSQGLKAWSKMGGKKK